MAFDTRFQGPFTMQVVGGTSGGKSYFLAKVIRQRDTMITPKVDKVIYCYSEYQKMFEEMPDVEFVRGFSEEVVKRENLVGHTWIVIDDLIDEVDDKLLRSCVVKLSHHRAFSLTIVQNHLYYKGLQSMHEISQNTHYLILFKSARDASSITTLARQMFGQKYKLLTDAYEDSTKNRFGYLVIDSKPTTPDIIRLRTHIFPGEITWCYVLPHGSKKK